MMTLPNYYDLLHINRSANLDTIKKAFRKELALYHPDKNTSKNARVHFNLLVEGFDILSNPKKREAYDKMLRSTVTNKPIINEPKAKKQYHEWKEESNKKSKTYWDTSLAELLALDIFLEAGFSGLFLGTEDLFDGFGDSLGDILDIF